MPLIPFESSVVDAMLKTALWVAAVSHVPSNNQLK